MLRIAFRIAQMMLLVVVFFSFVLKMASWFLLGLEKCWMFSLDQKRTDFVLDVPILIRIDLSHFLH